MIQPAETLLRIQSFFSDPAAESSAARATNAGAIAIIKSPERLGVKRRSGARGGLSKIAICHALVRPPGRERRAGKRKT
jgi:hypothetical protein